MEKKKNESETVIKPAQLGSISSSGSDAVAFKASIVLRTMVIGASVGSAWFMLTCHQTADIYGAQMTAKYSYVSAFRFMAYANVIVSALVTLSVLSLALILKWKQGTSFNYNPSNSYFVFFIHDLAVMSLELAACAAATAVGYVGKYGIEEAGWIPICDNFSTFCRQAAIAVSLSYISFFSLLSLVIISVNSTRKLHYDLMNHQNNFYVPS